MLLNVAVTEYIFEGIFVILMFYIVRKARKTVYLLSKLERERVKIVKILTISMSQDYEFLLYIFCSPGFLQLNF